MANVKMTQALALELAISALVTIEDFNPEVIDKLQSMKTALDNKRTTPSKADEKKTAEQTAICDQIVNTLGTLAKPCTIAEMQAACSELAILTNQKMSAMLKKLVDSGRVVKTIEKKKTYFSLSE